MLVPNGSLTYLQQHLVVDRNISPISFLATLAILLLNSASTHADVVSNFSSLTSGTITGAGLNSVTTGGTWFLNAASGATFVIQDDGSGDKAILGDDITNNNGGTSTLMAISASVGNEVDLTTNVATFSFKTGTRRTGNDKGLRYQFVNQAGNVVLATLDWNHNANELVLNDGAVDEHSLAIGGEGFSSSNLASWDSTDSKVRDVSVVFSGTTVTATFGSNTLTSSFLASANDVGRLRLQRIGTSEFAKGAYLDEVSLTSTAIAVPEPSSLALAGVSGAAIVFRRRRRAV